MWRIVIQLWRIVSNYVLISAFTHKKPRFTYQLRAAFIATYRVSHLVGRDFQDGRSVRIRHFRSPN